MTDWRPIDTAPYSTPVLGWLYLPKNPVASGVVVANRCYLQEDEPESYAEMQMTVGCWWANGRYYHAKGHTKDNGYIAFWHPMPDPPSTTTSGTER